MSLTDEELDAQLEKLQQNITLTLQSIDQNFEKCNQIVTGSIIPEVDKFTKASREIWERSKSWLYFFQLQAYGTTDNTQELQHTTNRPPFNPYTTTNTTTMDHTHPTSTLSTTWERFHRDLHKHRGATFEQSSSPGTDSMKGLLRPDSRRPPRVVENTTQHNISVARSIHQQIHDSGDLSSTQSSYLYAPTVRLLGIDDEVDSINNSSKDGSLINKDNDDRNMGNNDTHDMMDQYDRQSAITATPGMHHATPSNSNNNNTTTTTTTTAAINNSSSRSNNSNTIHLSNKVVDKGKSVDTSNKMWLDEENPMLQDHGTTNQSTLFQRLDAARRIPITTADIDMDESYNIHSRRQHYIDSTPGRPSYNSDNHDTLNSTTNNPMANTPTVERVLMNHNKDYRKLPKRHRILDDIDSNPSTAPADPFRSPSSNAVPSRRSTAAGDFSSSSFAAPTQHDTHGRQQPQHDNKGTTHLRDSGHNNHSQGTSLQATHTKQDDDFGFTRPRSIHEPRAVATPPPAQQQRQSPDRLAPSPLRSDPDGNDDMDMAYEFSPVMPRHAQDDEDGGSGGGRFTPYSQRDTSSSHASGYTTTGSISSMMTMMTGVSGQIPAKFALHYFPETFRDPPASVRLTKMYNLFAERPGQMLSWKQVVDLMRADQENDDEALFQQDTLRLFLDVLTRKRFLRRMEKGWTLRR
ncbi:hypothetical protein BCR42DRAFT_449150 [Absidia repens]|uniref:Uncharacterized protein n=1 Tax=Absidia repens TaxID=90262 RepID=A0A1X2IMZ8_9FUNG|nr:hypothetical protein BCR42DRAFT_449150 [Absidia repens]